MRPLCPGERQGGGLVDSVAAELRSPGPPRESVAGVAALIIDIAVAPLTVGGLVLSESAVGNTLGLKRI